MKIAAFLFIMFVFVACTTVKQVPPSADKPHSYCFGNVQEQVIEKKFYKVIYELSDTLNNRNLPLYCDSTLVSNPIDSISGIGNYIRKIQFPEIWKDMAFQGASYYALKVDEMGKIQTISPLRVLDKNDLIFPQLERHLLHLKFIGERFLSKYIFSASYS